MEVDPFDILGVSRDSGPDDWKRAYRRLAMRWHPDRNADPAATDRFKEISAAYEQLMAADDPEVVDEASRADEDAAAEQAPTVPRAADIRLNITVSLEEAAFGCRQPLHYTRGKPCATCDGSGEAGMSKTRFCEACHGSGRVHDADRVLVRCGDCNGRGLFTERICPGCGGSGRETDDISLEITIPPGMLAGDELRLVGQGEPGDELKEPGDLYLTLVIRAHPLYRLSGRELQYSMPVSALTLMAGGAIALPSLAGMLDFSLDAGLPEHRLLRVSGKGYPGRGGHPAGDLVVDLLPVFPRVLNAQQRKLLGQANAALLEDAESALPEIHAWQQANGLN